MDEINVKNAEIFHEIRSLMIQHHKMFENAIPLIASENITSPAVREAICCDFSHRYAEGWPGERVYAGCKFIDPVELKCMELAKQYWRAGFADVRPISGVVANLIAYTAISKPGDTLMCLQIPDGGHISHNLTSRNVHGLEIQYMDFDNGEMNIILDTTLKKIQEVKPKIVLLGASVFLFPHPVKEISEVAHEVGATVIYDAAHVAGLIGSGYFQQPLEEGADLMTCSTHKTFPGPQHGCILGANNEELHKKIKSAAFPYMLSNHHLHNVAGFAIALTEMKEFGKEYHKLVIQNAKDLAQALYERGFNVLMEHKGFTESHTILCDITKFGKTVGYGATIENILEDANIILNRNLIPGDFEAGRRFKDPGGVRIGTSEITRLGMKKNEMEQIAEFIKQLIVDRKDTKIIREEVAEFRKDYQKVNFCFENKTKAYEYLKLD
ncbi:MAG: serine hydroxymethyltransferase [Candidatus Helarchaeota archaeon]